MGIGTGTNAWWNDVLENGPSSPSARFFDVDWTPVKEELHAKLLLPILGDQYGQVLERGELQLVFRDGALGLRYFEHELPINPRQAPRVYRQAVGPLTEVLGADNPQLHEFLSIISSAREPAAVHRLRIRSAWRCGSVRRKSRADGWRGWSRSRPPSGQAIEAAVVGVQRRARARPRVFDALHELLEMQPYRLAYWRTASHEINYRRFFDINTLAGLRVEDPQVFAHTHQLLKALLADGKVQAVRIDHPDGLFDPARYFSMLQDLAAEAWNIEREPERGGRPDRPLYVLAEKILSGREALPRRWAVHGTTGYNYLNDLNGLYIDTSAGAAVAPGLRQAHRPHRAVRRRALREQAADHRHGDGERADGAHAHARPHRRRAAGKSRDFTRDSLREVITEVVACFPVYRTYVDEEGWTPEDRAVVERADRPRAAAQPGDGIVAVRLLPRGDAAARRRYRSAAERQARRLSAADRRRTRASGCGSP